MSLSLSLCLAMRGRGVAGHGKFRYPLLRNPLGTQRRGRKPSATRGWRMMAGITAAWKLNEWWIQITKGRNVLVRALVVR